MKQFGGIVSRAFTEVDYSTIASSIDRQCCCRRRRRRRHRQQRVVHTAVVSLAATEKSSAAVRAERQSIRPQDVRASTANFPPKRWR
jgi:hypothetical protein